MGHLLIGQSYHRQKLFIAGLIFVLASTATAASLYKKSLDKKIDSYVRQGVFFGGRSGTQFTLLNVRRQHSTKLNTERVILDMGDHKGRPLLQQLSYYQVSVQANPPRVIIDLAQVNRSRVSEQQLAKLFVKSPLVKKVEITTDPQDHGSTLVLHMAAPFEAEVFEMLSAKKVSRIAIDLRKRLK